MYSDDSKPQPKVSGTLGVRGPDRFLRTILVGTDLSEAAPSALEAAAHLLPPRRGTIHVLHVLPNHDRWLPRRGASAPEADQEDPADEPAVSDRFPRLVQLLRDAGLEDRGALPTVRVGRPFQAIKAVAEEVAADLIVLGRHRPRRAFDGLLGSTAERVVRTTATPCLLVNREIQAVPRRIMVATDLSPHGEHAAQVAAGWARQWAADLGVRHTTADRHVRVELVSIADYARPGYRPLERTDALRHQERAASEAAGEAVDVGARVASYPLAPEGIHKVAEALGADLVFIGTHGFGPVLRHLFGSVTSEVIRTLPLPVVVVPLPDGR